MDYIWFKQPTISRRPCGPDLGRVNLWHVNHHQIPSEHFFTCKKDTSDTIRYHQIPSGHKEDILHSTTCRNLGGLVLQGSAPPPHLVRRGRVLDQRQTTKTRPEEKEHVHRWVFSPNQWSNVFFSGFLFLDILWSRCPVPDPWSFGVVDAWKSSVFYQKILKPWVGSGGPSAKLRMQTP